MLSQILSRQTLRGTVKILLRVGDELDIALTDAEGNCENTAGTCAESEVSVTESNVETGKRGREYQFLDGEAVVAIGHEIPDQTLFENVPVYLETNAILCIDEVINSGQLKVNETVVWKRNCMATNTDAHLLPCKVLSSELKEGIKLYKLYSASGILKNTIIGYEQCTLPRANID